MASKLRAKKLSQRPKPFVRARRWHEKRTIPSSLSVKIYWHINLTVLFFLRCEQRKSNYFPIITLLKWYWFNVISKKDIIYLLKILNWEIWLCTFYVWLKIFQLIINLKTNFFIVLWTEVLLKCMPLTHHPRLWNKASWQLCPVQQVPTNVQQRWKCLFSFDLFYYCLVWRFIFYKQRIYLPKKE